MNERIWLVGFFSVKKTILKEIEHLKPTFSIGEQQQMCLT